MNTFCNAEEDRFEQDISIADLLFDPNSGTTAHEVSVETQQRILDSIAKQRKASEKLSLLKNGQDEKRPSSTSNSFERDPAEDQGVYQYHCNDRIQTSISIGSMSNNNIGRHNGKQSTWTDNNDKAEGRYRAQGMNQKEKKSAIPPSEIEHQGLTGLDEIIIAALQERARINWDDESPRETSPVDTDQEEGIIPRTRLVRGLTGLDDTMRKVLMERQRLNQEESWHANPTVTAEEEYAESTRPIDLYSVLTSLAPTVLEALIERARFMRAQSTAEEERRGSDLTPAVVDISQTELMRTLSSLDPVVLEAMVEAARLDRAEPMRPAGVHAISVLLERHLRAQERLQDSSVGGGSQTTGERVASLSLQRHLGGSAGEFLQDSSVASQRSGRHVATARRLSADMVQGIVGAHAIPGLHGTTTTSGWETSSEADEDLEQGREASVSNSRGAADEELKKEKRRKRTLIASIVLVIALVGLVLAIVLPLQLQQSSSLPASTPQPTPTPPKPQTLSPSLTPPGIPFREFGPELVGESDEVALGSAVAVVGDRWYAYGVPGHGLNRTGLVRVVDMYNGTQIGQDIVGNSTLGFTEAGRFLSSVQGGWLAVAGLDWVRLLRYNDTSALWESHGRVLNQTDLIPPEFRFAGTFVDSISINPFLFDGGNTISLAVVSFASGGYNGNGRDSVSLVQTFTLNVHDDPAPEWQELGDRQRISPYTVFASIVPGPRLMVGAKGTPDIVLYALDGSNRWVASVRVVTHVREIGEMAVLHHDNVTSTLAYHAEGLVRVGQLRLGSVAIDFQGPPFASEGFSWGEIALYNKDWVARASDKLSIFHYESTNNEWVQQGNSILLDTGTITADAAVAIGGDPQSPIVVAGIPGSGVRVEAVHQDDSITTTTNTSSSFPNNNNNNQNLFTNETGHVFANKTVYTRAGAIQLYRQEEEE